MHVALLIRSQRSKEFHSGTGRDFCKIPGSRDFQGRDLPRIFIPGFFRNCWDFTGYLFLMRLVVNLNIFHEQESPTNIFSIRKTDQLIVGEMICKDLHMPYRNF